MRSLGSLGLLSATCNWFPRNPSWILLPWLLEIRKFVWANMFVDRPIDKQNAEGFLTKWSKKLPEFNWLLTEAQFFEVMNKTIDSSPGSDGVPIQC